MGPVEGTSQHSAPSCDGKGCCPEVTSFPAVKELKPRRGLLHFLHFRRLHTRLDVRSGVSHGWPAVEKGLPMLTYHTPALSPKGACPASDHPAVGCLLNSIPSPLDGRVLFSRQSQQTVDTNFPSLQCG